MINGRNNNNSIGRNLGVFTAICIVVANMIGTGIFTTSGIMAANLPGPLWVIGCWLFGGLIAITGALCYAELGTRMPEEGGEYIYFKKLYHPSLAFLTGWTSLFVGFSAPIAGGALAFSEYFFTGLNKQFNITNLQDIVLVKKTLAIYIILTFTFLHYIGLKKGSLVQNILTGLKILIMLALPAAGLLFGSGDWSNVIANGNSFSLTALGTAMIMVMFSYSGWNATSYIAGELKDPKKSLPFSLVTGTIIVIIIYSVLNLFIFYSTPYGNLKNEVAVVEVASTQAFGGWMGNLFGFIISLTLLSSISAFIMIGPRIYYAMAKDRLFFDFASKVHYRYKVPSKSILLQGTAAMIMVIIGSFEQLYIYMGLGLVLFPCLAVAGIYIARKRKIGEENAVKVKWYPVLPLFFLLSTLILTIFTIFNNPLESLLSVLTILAGIPFYFLWEWRMKKK